MCNECHRFLSRLYRLQARSELLKSRELFYAGVRQYNDQTHRRFKKQIHTLHVLVAVDPCKPGYIGLAIGFLPGDRVIVLNDLGRLQRVKLEDIYNYGETSHQSN